MKTIASRLSAYKCPTAAALYLHLLELATHTGQRRLRVTRQGLAAALGIGQPYTVTKALRHLKREKLISYRVRNVVKKDGTYGGKQIRISLDRSTLSVPSAGQISEGRSTLSVPSVKTNLIGQKHTQCTITTVGSKANCTTLPSAVVPSPEQKQPKQQTPEELAAIFCHKQVKAVSR